jgi:hypothetical protein
MNILQWEGPAFIRVFEMQKQLTFQGQKLLHEWLSLLMLFSAIAVAAAACVDVVSTGAIDAVSAAP